MRSLVFSISILLLTAAGTTVANAQALEICTRSGGAPSLGEGFGAVPYVYGKVKIPEFDPPEKLPKISVGFTERGRPEKRIIVDQTGNYCFRRTTNDMDALVAVYVDSTEVGRRQISGFGPAQQREDFEINIRPDARQAIPGTINAKYNYPPNAKTSDLYRKAINAEKANEKESLIEILKQIVSADAADFPAWARLGALYFEKKSWGDAEDAFQKALSIRADYVPAMITLSQIYLAQIKTDQALALAQRAVAAEPSSARANQVLGNAYLQAKKGSLGVEALNKAIALDPVGMANSHLLLATLYDRAGAKALASREYRLFLEKVKDHPERKKFERYIKENPEAPADR